MKGPDPRGTRPTSLNSSDLLGRQNGLEVKATGPNWWFSPGKRELLGEIYVPFPVQFMLFIISSIQNTTRLR